jgi:hypothetical protein
VAVGFVWVKTSAESSEKSPTFTTTFRYGFTTRMEVA